MRYRLRTLLIALALGPPVLAFAWWATRPVRPQPPPRDIMEEHKVLTDGLPDPPRSDWE